ncbi:insulinase family protein, partial [bacterium]|nr:insulinase family protein [bacterium]
KKADLLNNYNTFLGDPGRLQWDLDRHLAVSPAAVQRYAVEYLQRDLRAVLSVVPAAEPLAAATSGEPAGLPAPGPAIRFSPPAIQRAALANGLELYLVEKRELPLVQVTLNIRSGWAADPADRPGTAALTAELLDEGTARRDALAISEAARRLGARLSTESGFDASRVSLNVLRRELGPGLALMSDLVLGASFPPEELERQRQRLLGQVQQENAQPRLIAMKLMQKRLYGEGHPYAQPMTGTGTAASIQRLRREDLVAFHAAHYRPNNAAVVVVGDLTLADAIAALEKAFRKWEAAPVPAASIPAPRPAGGPRVCLVDRPGAQQSMILLGQLGPRRADPAYLPFEVMNAALGGGFIARINMNLREDKGYTYGSYSFVNGLKGAGAFACAAPVHTQFTGAALKELLREIGDIRGPRPIGDEEFRECQGRLVQGYPARFETLEGMAGQLSELLVNELPLSHWSDYMARVQAVDRETANRSAREQLDPDRMQIVIVGDRSAVLPQLAELGLTDVQELKAEEL